MTKAEFDEILKNIGLTRKEFATLTNMAYSSVSNWSDENKPVPGWVSSWLENYIDKKRFDTIKQVIKDSELQ